MYLDALHTDKFTCDLATKGWGGTIATPKIVTQKQVIFWIGMFFPKIATSIKCWYQSWINSPPQHHTNTFMFVTKPNETALLDSFLSQL